MMGRRLLAATSLVTLVYFCVQNSLVAQCVPPNGTYTAEIIFPFGSTIETCPGNTIEILVRANAVDPTSAPIPIDGYGFNVSVNAAGTITIVEGLSTAGFVPANPGVGAVLTEAAAADAVSSPGPPAIGPLVGPVDLMRIVFVPTPLAPASPPQSAVVDFTGTVTFANGFQVANHLVETIGTCSATPSTTPPLLLIVASMTIEPCSGEFIRGDCNNNGIVGSEVADPIALLKFQFLNTFFPPCLNACDFNDDDTLNITDALNELAWIFLGTFPPAPPAPSPIAFPGSCGPDPTPGPLSCQFHICP